MANDTEPQTQVPLYPEQIATGRAATSERTRLAVIVPCFNEAETIHYLASKLIDLTEVIPDSYSLEWVIVDDGSRDTTWQLLHEHFGHREDVRLVQHPTNLGIAGAIATGFANTDAPIVASIDADCSYDPSIIVELVSMLTDGIDCVVASPYHPAGQVVGVPPWRLRTSQCASLLYASVFRSRLHTYTSCVRVCRREAVQGIALKRTGFVGVVEFLWLLDAQGAQIAECPATLTIRQFGHSKMRFTRTIFQHFRFLASISIQRLVTRRT